MWKEARNLMHSDGLTTFFAIEIALIMNKLAEKAVVMSSKLCLLFIFTYLK